MVESLDQSSPSVSGVVMVVPQHVKLFSVSLIPNLSEFVRPLDDLLIVCSGLSARGLGTVRAALRNLPEGWRTKVVEAPLGSVGANRNIGMSHASGDLVTFLDADDLFAPHYRQFIVEAFHRAPYESLLHSYIAIGGDQHSVPPFDDMGLLEEISCYGPDDFVIDVEKNWSEDPTLLESTQLRLLHPVEERPIHQGHLTIRGGLDLRFHENYLARNEDGVFLQTLLARGAAVHYYPLRLSAYRLGTSANPTRFRIARKLEHEIRKHRKSSAI